MDIVTFDDFKKVELKVGRISEAEDIVGSEKLLKLKVDLGSEQRQIVAGIKKQYAPADLINKEVVVVANLAPRMVMGVESQGMVLCASDDTSGPVVLRPEKDVAPGAGVR